MKELQHISKYSAGRIKCIGIIVLVILNLKNASAQDKENPIYLEIKNKSQLCYVEMNLSTATVYQIGSYLDVAGTGPSFRSIDTLMKQSDGSFVGKKSSLMTRNQKNYLTVTSKKTKEYQLDTSENLNKVYLTLNNAYFLDRFFIMSNELNKIYPLNHYSFRNGFSRWKVLQGKEMEHHQFRGYADIQLKNISDSIIAIQNQYSALHQWLVLNIHTIEYNSLKDSLIKLPTSNESTSSYFGNVVKELSKQKPEYYFKLAEDLPEHKNMIFYAVENNKEVVESLKAVEGHDQVKKEFLKERKFNRTMPFKIIGAYIIAAGLIILLIVAQP